ncbi:MAG: hypothetical protein HFG60_08550 [Lachnospiraceae bacterium]|nr:hypothetical protein [Lachnospiraceae bacterium]
MKNRFKVIGYYICEIYDTPEWLRGVSRQILSVSGCIGGQHPRWECFTGGWRKGEAQEYQERLQLDKGQYREFSEMAGCLFDAQRLDVDGRFPLLSDARGFYEKFCQAPSCCVVSVSTTTEYYKILSDEWKGSNSHALTDGENDNSQWLGNDILGWDIGGFHSFLCNSLQKELPGAKFNGLGLLGNVFPEVEGFAHQIQGKGEPVEWIPCRIGGYGQPVEFDRLTGGERWERQDSLHGQSVF